MRQNGKVVQEAIFVEGKLKGRIVMKNNDIYEGEVNADTLEPEGEGCLTIAKSGEVVEGVWKDGKMQE